VNVTYWYTVVDETQQIFTRLIISCWRISLRICSFHYCVSQRQETVLFIVMTLI